MGLFGILAPGASALGTAASGGSKEEVIGKLDWLDASGTQAGLAAKEEEEQALLAAQGYGQTAMDLQSAWMEEMKGLYSPYTEMGQQAMGAQGALAGLGGEAQRQEMIQGIQDDPLYQAQLAAGSEAAARHQAGMGGFRGGTTAGALAQQNQLLLGQNVQQRQQDLAQLSGMGLQGLQGYGIMGGQALSDITGTLGSLGSAQLSAAAGSKAAAAGQTAGFLGAAGSIGGAAMTAFSDERLKTNITKIDTKHGMPWYEWEWNQTAKDRFGLSGPSQGHMVSDVEIHRPELVGERGGYRTVNYGGF